MLQDFRRSDPVLGPLVLGDGSTARTTVLRRDALEPLTPGTQSEAASAGRSVPVGGRRDRLHDLVERRADEYRRFGRARHPAIEAPDAVLTYDDLDIAANRLARFLLALSLAPGDRVAVLIERAVDDLVAQLAIAKLGAVWIPLERTETAGGHAAVVAGTGVGIVLTSARLAPLLGACEASVVVLDRHLAEVSLYAPLRWRPDDHITWVDSPASIITRRQRGTTELQATAVGHDAAINTVRATAPMLQLGPRDRVFHDPRSASEFAVLDAWLPWACGATLIVPRSDFDTRGAALERLLRERRVTVLRADARTLAVITPDLPDLRLVLVTGPDRPVDLIARWQRPGRRLIALHGSPETGPAALHTELRPDRSVRTERPLPTYGVVVLDPAHPDRRLPVGAIGQIGITGAGLARGYVGRPRFTGEAFIVDAEGTRIFRTGDLGRITSTGEVERTGRITSDQASHTDPPPQAPEFLPVRPRSPLAPRPPGGSTRLTGPRSRPAHRGPAVGHPRSTVRIVRRPQTPPVSGTPAASAAIAAPTDESAEAARTLSLLSEVLGEVLQRDDILGDAHFFDDLGADSMLMARFCARVRKHPELPSVSMHDVYNHSTPAALAAALIPAPATPATVDREERVLVDTLAEVLGRTDVTATSHFFDDLGADSMLMARVCARVRRRLEVPWPSIQDVYRHPTAKELATAHQAAVAGAVSSEKEPEPSAPPPAPLPAARAGTTAFVLCGVAQTLCALGYAYLTAVLLTVGFEWVTVPLTPLETYLRVVTVSAGGFVVLAVLPVVAKWLLVGRWRPRTIRIWSLGYLRFWVVKTLVSTNPMVLFAGSPLYNLYLRALGAKIGRGAVLLSSRVVCTDVFSVGAGSLVRKDALLSCYRARDGYIEIGGVSLGAGVVIGEATVLDVCTTVGDDASLNHSSALYAGQTVPSGESWHGSPGRPTETPVPRAPAMRCGTLRRALYSTLSLAVVLGVALPAGVILAVLAYRAVPWLTTLLQPGPGALTDAAFYGRTVVLSALVYFGAALIGLGMITTLPRLLAALVRPDRTYPLYGLHYWLHQAVVVTTNVRAFVALFGDSSAIPHYLRLIGYRLRPMVQTGSNFGMAVKHENPYLTAVGSETVVADGLSVMNADYSSTSFRVSTTRIGARNFLGNRIAYPPQGRTGDDCLLATKVAVPTDGVLREGVGLLGSPSFEIPRTVARDSNLDTLDAAAVRSSLRRKNRHNLTTVLIHLVARWVPVLVAAFAVGVMAALPVSAGAAEIVIVELLLLFTTTLWFVLAERSVSRLKAHAPDGCSIYDRAFWRHERHWKAAPQEWMQLFNGTPLKGLVWRMLGVRIGRRTFDDGLSMTEKAFVTIGDDCVFNAGSVIQCHSQEDGAFKSDLAVVGSRATLGVAAFVHYGTTIGDDTLLEADSFLMKGEEIAAGERWGGNPACEIPQVPSS